MKPIYLLFFIFLFSSCRKDILHWQSVEQINVATDDQLNTAVFLTNGIGIIGGGSRFGVARIFISTDHGASWQAKQMPDDSKGFFGSCVTSDDKVYFCGFGLNISVSKEGINTFKNVRIPGPYEFTSAISFGGNNLGVATTILGTDSGGIVRFDSSFNLLSFQRINNAMHDIHMFNNKIGIAVGSGTVLKTSDGGLHWDRQSVIGDNFNSISALDSNRIFVSGLSGYIIRTVDGGKNWKRLRNGGNITLPNYQLWDLLFINENKGYAVGEKGLVIFTDDGGNHWSEYDRFTTNNLRFISLCPDGKLLVGGENGTLYRLAK